MKPKINIFKQYFYAIAQPHKYNDLSNLGGGRLFLFSLILALIITAIYVTPVASFFIRHGGTNGLIREYIPDYDYHDGQLELDYSYKGHVNADSFDTALSDLSVEDDTDSVAEFINVYFENIKPYLFYFILRAAINPDEVDTQNLTNFTNTDFYLYIDTSMESVEDINFEDLNITATEGLFITKSDCILFPYSYGSSNTTIHEAWQNETLVLDTYTELFGTKDFSRDDLIEELRKTTPYLYILYVLACICIIIYQLAKWYLAGLFFSLIAMITSSLLHKNSSFGLLYKISVYAQTTTITLLTLHTLLSFIYIHPTALTWIGRLITIIYIIIAIVLLRNEPEMPARFNDQDDPEYYNAIGTSENNYDTQPYNNSENEYNNQYSEEEPTDIDSFEQ